MNTADSEIVTSLLSQHQMNLSEGDNNADVILLNTCAIRENAEAKIWNKLSQYTSLKKKRHKEGRQMVIGVLGCMAERLKKKIVEEQKVVDLVVGPDAYKDLPRLVNLLLGEDNMDMTNYAINTQLSIDETYADVIPVRTTGNGLSAFVSIMRLVFFLILEVVPICVVFVLFLIQGE
jgi:tRNA-2-methylthio-N6-dimethylallyladenosine synthase